MANKTRNFATTEKDPVLVDVMGLQEMTRSGRHTALKIAEAAGARVQIGRRVLFNVSRIKKYIESISE